MELLAGVACILFGLFGLFIAVGIVVSGSTPILAAIFPLGVSAVFFKWAYDLLTDPQGL